MKKLFAAAALAVFAMTALPACSKDMSGLEIDSRVDVPNFTLPDLEGQMVTLSEFKGQRPVLLVFWATWCPYCKEEMPNLMALKEKYGDRLQILAIDIQESRQKVASYASGQNFNFPVLLDEEGEVAEQYGVAGVPTLVLIDKDGKGVVAENALNSRLLQAVEKAAAA